MIRYLSIFLMTALLGFVLWLPSSHTANQFYHAARLDHSANTRLWGAQYAAPAMMSALATLDAHEQSARPPPGTDPVSLADRQLAARMQAFIERMRSASYLRAVEGMTMLALYRLATMLYLAPAALLLLLPSMADAAVRRIVRTHEFRSHDPERYALAIAGGMTLCAGLAVLCVLPLPLPPLLALGAMFGMVYCAHVALANYHHSGT